jgi:hypothetical protein
MVLLLLLVAFMVNPFCLLERRSFQETLDFRELRVCHNHERTGPCPDDQNLAGQRQTTFGSSRYAVWQSARQPEDAACNLQGRARHTFAWEPIFTAVNNGKPFALPSIDGEARRNESRNC